jgi:hypothetical protein
MSIRTDAGTSSRNVRVVKRAVDKWRVCCLCATSDLTRWWQRRAVLQPPDEIGLECTDKCYINCICTFLHLLVALPYALRTRRDSSDEWTAAAFTYTLVNRFASKQDNTDSLRTVLKGVLLELTYLKLHHFSASASAFILYSFLSKGETPLPLRQ